MENPQISDGNYRIDFSTHLRVSHPYMYTYVTLLALTRSFAHLYAYPANNWFFPNEMTLYSACVSANTLTYVCAYIYLYTYMPNCAPRYSIHASHCHRVVLFCFTLHQTPCGLRDFSSPYTFRILCILFLTLSCFPPCHRNAQQISFTHFQLHLLSPTNALNRWVS